MQRQSNYQGTQYLVQSFFRPDSFCIILRGTKVIVGDVDDLQTDDLKIVGNLRRASLSVARYRDGKFTVIGGRFGCQTRAMNRDVAERVCDTMRFLNTADWFVCAAVLILEEAPKPSIKETLQQVVQAAAQAVFPQKAAPANRAAERQANSKQARRPRPADMLAYAS